MKIIQSGTPTPKQTREKLASLLSEIHTTIAPWASVGNTKKSDKALRKINEGFAELQLAMHELPIDRSTCFVVNGRFFCFDRNGVREMFC